MSCAQGPNCTMEALNHMAVDSNCRDERSAAGEEEKVENNLVKGAGQGC
jgi:hypothetical protein